MLFREEKLFIIFSRYIYTRHSVWAKRRFFSNQQSANEQIGLKHWHMKCMYGSFLLYFAGCHICINATIFKETRLTPKRAAWKIIWRKFVVHKSTTTRYYIGEKWIHEKKKKNKEKPKNKRFLFQAQNHEAKSCLSLTLWVFFYEENNFNPEKKKEINFAN